MAHRGRQNADDLLAAELAAGKTAREAAAAAGVAERTVFRRLADARFKARVSAFRGEMVSAAAGRLAADMGTAADALRGLVADLDPGVRLRASVQVLRIGSELAQLQELATRVEELTEKLAAIENDRGHSPRAG